MSDIRLPGVFSGFSPWTLVRAMFAPADSLSAADSALDLFRFFRSKHVRDLKVIALISFAAGVAAVWAWRGGWQPENAAATVAACGAVIGWAYRSASARLGVVDLFACEISTLCRVGTIFDTAKHYITWYDAGPGCETLAVSAQAERTPKFVSQEEYFPVLATNAPSLQLLQADVVNYIIAFYTYMKGVRDQLRALAEIDLPAVNKDGDGSEQDGWHATLFNIVYSVFLGYENARKAVKNLIEFEPAAAESNIAILLTEIRCYAFLLRAMPLGDFRYERLRLREADYEEEVIPLCRKVESQRGRKHEKDWGPALHTAPELEKRYRQEYMAAIRTAKLKRGDAVTAPANRAPTLLAPRQ
jgi:hypothetical protein